jgi:hypothetical protein
MTDISAAIQSHLRVAKYFSPETQGAALDALVNDPASIGEIDRRALATLAITGNPQVQATAQKLLNNVV